MRLQKGGMPVRATIWLITLLVLLAGTTVAAQDNQAVSVELTASPEVGVVNETEFTATITISGDASLCPVQPNDRSVDAVLLIDTSDSMSGQRLTSAIQAALVFVETMTLNVLPEQEGDQIGLVQFNSNAGELVPLTQQVDVLQTAILALDTTGSTEIDEGLNRAVQTLTNSDTQNPLAARVIVLLSDGEDNESQTIRAADQAKSAGARLVTIALGDRADAQLLAEIASSPSDHYLAPDPSELVDIFRRVAETIQPRTSASDGIINFRVDSTLFEIVPDSANPPASVITADTVGWVFNRLDSGESLNYRFRVRGRQLSANAPVGSLFDSSFFQCEDETARRDLIGAGPFINIQLPTPTPTATATPTPLPTPTPTVTPTATPPAWLNGSFIPAASSSTSLGAALGFCADGFWSLLPLLLALLLLLLFLIWFWWQLKRLRNGECSLICFVTRVLLGGYAAFALWLFLLPPAAALCEGRESVYFWKQSPESGLTGVFLTAPNIEESTAFSEVNEDGCVGCHTVSSQSNQIAAVRGTPPSQLIVYNFDGTPLEGLPPVRVNYMAFSPDGTRLVVADENADLQIINLETMSMQPLQGASDPAVVETMPSWGSNGQIAFVRTTNQSGVLYAGLIIVTPTDIYTVPETGGAAQPLLGASSNGFNYYPSYSPDGQWLAFTHHNNETTYSDPEAEIHLVAATGGNPIRLAANNDENGNALLNPANSWPSWSLDSRFLAFNSQRSDPAYDIFVVEIDENGNSTAASPLPGASQFGVFEHTPFWGVPISRVNTLAQILSLWPFLTPLLPLAMFAWVACRRRTTMIEEPPPPPPAQKLEPPPVPDPPVLEPPPVLWEPAPALIIGLGETGRWVLTHLKKTLRDGKLDTMPEKISLLCLDTGDYQKLRQQTTPITFAGVELAPEETIELKDNLSELVRRSDLKTDSQFRFWLSDAAATLQGLGEARLDLAEGAQQQRLLARAGFLKHLRDASPNFFDQLLEIMPNCLNEDGRSNIIIVGDTMGDISSAVLFDVALLAREAARKSGAGGTTITAHLVTDQATHAISNDLSADQANTGATLREIERFQLAQARPFPISYNQIDKKVCNWLPLDDLMLYDGTGLEDIRPEIGIYPAVADAITLWMDKAADQGELRQLRNGQHRNLADTQHRTYQVHVFSQGIFSYRLPFADLLQQVRYRFEDELFLLLTMGPRGDRSSSLTWELNNENIFGDNQPRTLAEAFLNGSIGVTTDAPPPEQTLAMFGALRRGQTANVVVALRNVEKDAENALLSRLQATLTLLLNGSGKTLRQENGIFTARGGKIQYTLDFLAQLQIEIDQVGQMLTNVQDETSNRDFLLKALESLNTAAQTYADSLQQQAKLLGLKRSDTDTVRQRIDTRLVSFQEHQKQMDAVTTRHYIWGTEAGALENVWYKKHITKENQEGERDQRGEALGQFFWQVDTDSQQVTLALIRASDVPGQTIETPLTPDTVAEFEADLLDLVTRYCEPIVTAETLADLLTNNYLDEDHLRATLNTLNSHSSALLGFASEQAPDAQYTMILSANKNVAVANLQSDLQVGLTHQNLLRLETTEPYSLTLNQQVAIVPLPVITTLDAAQRFYRRNHGLSNEPNATRPAAPILTAVYEAEAMALQLETDLRALRLSRDLLHPLVVTALTDSERTKAFMLALASGEMEIRRGRGKDQSALWLTTPQDEIQFPPFVDEKLHLLVQGLLVFVTNRDTFSDTLVNELLDRYQRDSHLPAIWKSWLAGDWQDWLDELDEDTPDRTIDTITDILRVSRLYAREYTQE